MKSIIIQGSARPEGNTTILTRYLSEQLSVEVIDLLDLNFSGYDYQNRNADDDFLPLMRRLINDYDAYHLVTPVYWYTMSGLLKNFLDRFTDCLTIEKALGRRLAGKQLGLISMGSREAINAHFEEPIQLSTEYLEMTYLGHAHTWCIDDRLAPKAIKNLESYLGNS